MMAPPPDGTASLRRELGLLDAIGIGLGAVMGAGIFVVTGVAAGVAGPAMLVGLAVAGVAAMCNGLSSAQLAARYPQSGGTYEYGCQLLGPSAGFAAGWVFLASKLAAAGTVALGVGHYAATLVPGLPPPAAAAGAVVGVTMANWWGIRKTGKFNLVLVALTLAALGTFVLAGLPTVATAQFRPFAPGGWRGVAESSALLFFAYTGYARLATLGEEVRDPARTIPRAIIATLAISFVIYLMVAVVAIGSVGTTAMAASRAPLERAAETFGMPWVVMLLTGGGATAMLGVLLSQVLGLSRMMLAMARRGDLPGFLAHIDDRRGVPTYGIAVTSAIALALALFGTLEAVLAAAAFTILVYYAITNLAALKLPPVDRRYSPWIARVGLGFCLAMALSLQPRTIIIGILLLAVGFGLRWALRALRSRNNVNRAH